MRVAHTQTADAVIAVVVATAVVSGGCMSSPSSSPGIPSWVPVPKREGIELNIKERERGKVNAKFSH